MPGVAPAQLRQRIPVNKVLKLFDDRASYVCNARGCGVRRDPIGRRPDLIPGKLQIELEALDFGVGARAPVWPLALRSTGLI